MTRPPGERHCWSASRIRSVLVVLLGMVGSVVAVPVAPAAAHVAGTASSVTTVAYGYDVPLQLAESAGGRDERGPPHPVLRGNSQRVGGQEVVGALGAVRVRGFGVAAKTGSRLATSCMRSFAGDTPVLMADGTKKQFKNLKVGDLVIAENPVTGIRGPRRVAAVWVHQDSLYDFAVDGARIVTTEDHPFWSVTDQRWEDTQDLSLGELVLAADGHVGRVTETVNFASRRVAAAYNLTVDDLHTYFVGGGAGVLVHNDSGDVPMFGANGTRITSSTVWSRGGWRIDVENPDPGGRPGQVHLQQQINGADGPKYLYNAETGEFDGIPKSVKKMLAKTDYQRGVQKGLRFLGEC